MQDLNDLYYFVQVVDHAGFAAAARALGMPRSRLSRRIALLEERLGVRLIQRSTRRFSVTEIGQDYYRHCVAMLVEAKAADELIERSRTRPQGIVRVNKEAHQAIASYMAAHFPKGTRSPWAYYKLVNVQARPIDKPTPGQTYAGADAATYYQSNSTIETDYDLQVFSGQFYPYGATLGADEGGTLINTITDFNTDGTAFKNVAYDSHRFNMGGCMGCHGNAQHGGSDFSFILAGGRDTAPDTAGTVEPILANKVVKFLDKTK